MKPLALGIACLAVGFAVGLLAAPRSPESPLPAARPAPPAASAMPPASVDPAPELLRLQARVRELEARPIAAPDPDAGNFAAAELYAGLTDPKLHGNQAAWLKMLGRLGDLNPSMTPWCVKKFRDSRPTFDAVALELAVFSGGPDAVALLKEILGGAAASSTDRIRAGLILNGQSMIARAGHVLPVDEELAQLGRRTLTLADPYERMAGIGLLRFQDTSESRALLQGLVAQESHAVAKEAAVRSLGQVGDRASLEFLHAYALSILPPEADDETFERTPLQQALVDATRALKKRFPD